MGDKKMSSPFPPFGVPATMVTVICKDCEGGIFNQPWMISAKYVEYGPFCKSCAVGIIDESKSTASVFDEKCRCDGSQMKGSDHCPICFCEQYEETCTTEGRV